MPEVSTNNTNTPTINNNTMQQSSTEITKNSYSPLTYLRGNGSRAIPPLKRGKTSVSKGTQPIYKSFMVTEVDSEWNLHDVIEVKVDLNKLSRLYTNFDINQMQQEICYQLNFEGVMIILHKNGTPVKDTPNTRGVIAWNNKASYRVMSADQFKTYKPSSWEMIKRDYGCSASPSEFGNILSLFNTDDLLNTDSTSCSNLLSPSNPVTNFKHGITDTFVPTNGICRSPSKLSGLHNENDNNSLSNSNRKLSVSESELTRIMFDTKEEIKLEIRKRITNDNLKSIFRCVICFESRPDNFLACFHCGRYLGCYMCIVRLEKCPLCRKEFKCSKCSHQLPKDALFLPGIGEFLNLPVTVPDVPSMGDGFDSDDTIPATSGT